MMFSFSAYPVTRLAIGIGGLCFAIASLIWSIDGGVPLNSTQAKGGDSTQDAEK